MLGMWTFCIPADFFSHLLLSSGLVTVMDCEVVPMATCDIISEWFPANSDLSRFDLHNLQFSWPTHWICKITNIILVWLFVSTIKLSKSSSEKLHSSINMTNKQKQKFIAWSLIVQMTIKVQVWKIRGKTVRKGERSVFEEKWKANIFYG